MLPLVEIKEESKRRWNKKREASKKEEEVALATPIAIFA